MPSFFENFKASYKPQLYPITKGPFKDLCILPFRVDEIETVIAQLTQTGEAPQEVLNELVKLICKCIVDRDGNHVFDGGDPEVTAFLSQITAPELRETQELIMEANQLKN